jgi:transcriptional regulator with PAS, ATPase and Fis domain
MEMTEPDSTNFQHQESIKDAEKNHIQSILKKYDGDRQKVSKVLGIDKSTLWRKMKKYHLLK